MLEQALQDVESARIEIENEEKEEWISGSFASQALLISQKRESRFNKGKTFNAFVLEQAPTEENNEFDFFLKLLKKQAREIPSGTRMQLIVYTGQTDPVYDRDYYESGHREVSHWTVVDILIGTKGKISSFILDAANSVGYRRMRSKLTSTFPDGDHYYYRADKVTVSTGKGKEPRKVTRLIQTQDIGCRVFAIEHARQLSQIDTSSLYLKELPLLSQQTQSLQPHKTFPTGRIIPGSFKGGEKLLKVFRSMQSWTSLESLPQSVKDTPIKESGATLVQEAKRRSKGKLNLTVVEKNKRYKAKKKAYFQALSEKMRVNIMQNMNGLHFLRFPILFRLNEALAEANIHDFQKFISVFCDSAKEQLAQKQVSVSVSQILTGLEKDIDELPMLGEVKSIGTAKNQFLAYLENILNNLYQKEESLQMADTLVDILQKTIPLLQEEKDFRLTDTSRTERADHVEQKVLVEKKELAIATPTPTISLQPPKISLFEESKSKNPAEDVLKLIKSAIEDHRNELWWKKQYYFGKMIVTSRRTYLKVTDTAFNIKSCYERILSPHVRAERAMIEETKDDILAHINLSLQRHKKELMGKPEKIKGCRYLYLGILALIMHPEKYAASIASSSNRLIEFINLGKQYHKDYMINQLVIIEPGTKKKSS